jgi:release factor glutamine methyltransferase
MAQSPQEWTVLSMLEWATDYFEQREVPSPRMSIEWLLADVLDIKRLELYMKFDRPLSPQELSELRPLVKRRAMHEPLQYITGHTDFMNVRLTVTPDVLIPRMETEQLVEIILDRHPSEEPHTVLDVGTGSGCIPIAIQKECASWQTYGIDISEDALTVAHQNAEANQVEVHWQQQDMRALDQAKLPDTFDIIISNPPYILESERENLEPQVEKYEPGLALFCDSPAQYYEPVIRFASDRLRKGGYLYLELHDQHADAIREKFEESSWKIEVISDYDSNPRFLLAERLS